MNVRVLFFSVLQDATGLSETSMEVSAGATVSSLLVHLYERWPSLKPWDSHLLIAVDQTYAKRDTVLPEHAEVAIMPPVQGG